MRTAKSILFRDRLLHLLALVLLLLLPVLWFAKRLPDTRDGVHLTWNGIWILVPLALLLARRVLKDNAGQNGESIPGPGKARRFLQHLALGIFIPFLGLLVVEGLLKAKGVSYSFPPIVFETQEEVKEIEKDRVLADPVLLFKFKPGTHYNRERINALGYRDHEVNPVKAPGSKRVICFGDSITAQGRPGYSRMLHELLQNDPPSEHAWEAMNMAVYGYSSAQGIEVFRGEGKQLQPDIITAYFGPNDRNLNDKTDRMRMGKRMSRGSAWLAQKFRDKRIGQLVLHRAQQQAMKRYQAQAGNREKVARVPAEEYRENMIAFVKEAREIGATPILITAPRRELVGITSGGAALSVEAVSKRHDDYNQIVRDVCAELDAPLLDLSALMKGPEFDSVFAHDGIHFDSYATEHAEKPQQQPGLRFIATSLHEKIVELSTSNR